jgi:Flp pilus assembly pilin Flp
MSIQGRRVARSVHDLAEFLRSDEGQALVEYVVLLALVSVVVLVVLIVLGNQVRNVFYNITGAIVHPGPG